MMRSVGNGLDAHSSESCTAMTAKQRAFLERLGVKFDESWDKAEASRQIERERSRLGFAFFSTT